MHKEGFSLVEFLVAVSVLAVALGLGAPAFVDLLANSRMNATVNDLVASLHAARSEAIKRQAVVSLCPFDGIAGCDDTGTLEGGWFVYVDENADGEHQPGEPVLQQHGPVAASLKMAVHPAASPHYLAFDGLGRIRELPGLPPPLTNIQLCDRRGDVDTGGGTAAGRLVTVDATGRPALERRRSQVQRSRAGGC